MRSITNNTQFYYLVSFALHTLCVAYFLFQHPKSIHQTKDVVDFILVPFEKTAAPIPPKTQVAKKVQSNNPSEGVESNVSEKETLSSTTPSSEVENATETGFNTGTLARTIEQKYIAQIRETLERNKKFPPLAKKMGHTGQVLLKFELSDEGKIISKSIENPSNYESLNQAALKLLDQVQQFEKFPAEIKKQKWTFILPIEYKL